MWSPKFQNKPIKSTPTVVAAAVLVGALTVLASPLHSSREAIARAASHAAGVVAEEVQTQAFLPEKLVSEQLPASGLQGKRPATPAPRARSVTGPGPSDS